MIGRTLQVVQADGSRIISIANNDERTFAMELATFEKLRQYAGTTGKAVDMDEITATLKKFNNIQEDENGKVGRSQGALFAGARIKTEDGTSEGSSSEKPRELNKSLGAGNAIPYYSINMVCANRNSSIAWLPQDSYQGTILSTPEVCPTVRTE